MFIGAVWDRRGRSGGMRSLGNWKSGGIAGVEGLGEDQDGARSWNDGDCVDVDWKKKILIVPVTNGSEQNLWLRLE